MLIWLLIILIFIVLSMVQHLGFLQFGFLMDPWNKIILDIILLFIVLGIVYRIFTKSKKGEKENLKERIHSLENDIEALKGRNSGEREEKEQ